jgi:hypothetical protein
LAGGYLLYYPPAFDAYSNRLIELRVPPEKRIAIDEPDAITFACNAVNIDRLVIMNQASDGLKAQLADAGFEVVETPLTEFLKAGGAAKCLTLRVTEPLHPEPARDRSLLSRTVTMTGHLLDSGLVSRALDLIMEGGGSFQVLNFDLGEQRQSTSSAEIRVSAPDHEVMDEIMAQLIDLGAVALPQEQQDARLVTISQAGVAPDDFYSSTIYPTEVRVRGGGCGCKTSAWMG